jgi:hypothetical protein
MTMWCGTLRSDDIQQATAELRSQRAAIRARFDYEMKQLESKIGDLETLEHSVLNFVLNYKVEDGSSATVADPAPAAATVAHPGPAAATVAHPGPAAEEVAGEIASEQSSSTSTKALGEPDDAAEVVPLRASSETPDARPNVTLLNPRDSSGVWTPTERALLAIKRN